MCLGQSFVKFFVSIFKCQVNSSSNFASFFRVITHNSSVNVQFTYVLLWTKGSHKIPNFDIFKCSGENLPNSSQHFPNRKSVFRQILHHSSVSCKITPMHFLGQVLYTLHKRNQSKCKFWRFLRARIKIHQILVIFETTDQFFFKFCITLQYYET